MYMSYSALLSARGRRERAPVRPRRGLALRLTPPVVRLARVGRVADESACRASKGRRRRCVCAPPTASSALVARCTYACRPGSHPSPAAAGGRHGGAPSTATTRSSTRETAMQLSDEELARWDADGFLTIRSAFSEEELLQISGPISSHYRRGDYEHGINRQPKVPPERTTEFG